MNFLYPQFLFGFLAVLIPIIIHLFNLQRPRKVLFSNVRFLKEIQQSTSKSLKLKHLLVLLSRICFIIFLVLTFAQPFLINQSAEKIKGKPFVSVFLDNSFSMQNEIGQEKALDIGIKSFQQLMDLFPAVTSYNFLTNDFEGKDQYFRNKTKTSERISEVNLSSTYREANEILKRQHQVILNQGAENKHIVWFSDFQKETVGDLSKLSFDSTIHYHLVPIQNAAISNVSIDSAWLSNPLVKAGENNTLEILLWNSGEKEVRDLTLKLYIDDVQVSSALIDINPKSSAKSSFVFNVNGEGQKRASIKFEDYPVVFDNEYYLTFNVSPKITILHLFDDNGTSISNVYSNESIFEVTNNKVGDFDYSKIATANLIVLDGVDQISSALLKPLSEFVAQGGSLMVYPSASSDIKSYEAFAAQFGYQKPELIKPDSSLKGTSMLASPDYSNPFFSSVFEKRDPKLIMPYALSVMKWRQNGIPLLNYKNSDVFMSALAYQKGFVYLSTTDLKEEYTNLHRHSIFVPLMYKIAFASIVSSERLSYSFQEKNISIDLNQEKSDPGMILSLESKDFKVMPTQWFSGGKLILDLPSAQMKSGIYTLTWNGEVKKTIALNYGKRESQMASFSADELKEMTKENKNVKLYSVESSEQFLASFKHDNIGIPLWKYFLLGALMFLMIEIIIIRFIK